jgi:hypothetical protein
MKGGGAGGCPLQLSMSKMNMDKKLTVAQFYDWLAQIEPIIKAQPLATSAGLYKSVLNKHYRAIREGGKKGNEKMWTLSPQNFYVITKAFLKHTSTSLHLGGFTFGYHTETDKVFMVYGESRIFISESPFNAMFTI